MTIIGSPDRFASEFELAPEHGGPWLYGRFCFWCAGKQVGNYDVVTPLRYVLFELDSGKWSWRNRQSSRFSGLPAGEVFSTLRPILADRLAEIVDFVALEEVWVRFRLLPQLEIFEGWEAYLVGDGDSGRLIYSLEPFDKIEEVALALGEFDDVLRETWRVLMELWDEATLAYQRFEEMAARTRTRIR